MMHMPSPKRMIHFELRTRESEPVKLIANASTPIGSLHTKIICVN